MSEPFPVTDEERRLVKFLVETRKALHVTQHELGDILGISAQQLSKIERGKNRLPLGRFLAAMKFLKSMAEERAPTSAALSLGFAEAEQALYGVEDPRADLLRAARSLRERLDAFESALLAPPPKR